MLASVPAEVDEAHPRTLPSDPKSKGKKLSRGSQSGITLPKGMLVQSPRMPLNLFVAASTQDKQPQQLVSPILSTQLSRPPPYPSSIKEKTLMPKPQKDTTIQKQTKANTPTEPQTSYTYQTLRTNFSSIQNKCFNNFQTNKLQNISKTTRRYFVEDRESDE